MPQISRIQIIVNVQDFKINLNYLIKKMVDFYLISKKCLVKPKLNSMFRRS